MSDLEVESSEENGTLWHIRYPLEEGSGHVVYLERPDLFWPRVRRFFGSKDSGA